MLIRSLYKSRFCSNRMNDHIENIIFCLKVSIFYPILERKCKTICCVRHLLIIYFTILFHLFSQWKENWLLWGFMFTECDNYSKNTQFMEFEIQNRKYCSIWIAYDFQLQHHKINAAQRNEKERERDRERKHKKLFRNKRLIVVMVFICPLWLLLYYSIE